jgi:thiol-disulfide isomerase/thioredoxin
MAEESDYLIEFYGTECVHCKAMRPFAERLEEELGVKLTRYEVWHSEENLKIMQQYDKGLCGGVPFFYNTKSGKWLCGYNSYDKLKEWALSK